MPEARRSRVGRAPGRPRARGRRRSQARLLIATASAVLAMFALTVGTVANGEAARRSPPEAAPASHPSATATPSVGASAQATFNPAPMHWGGCTSPDLKAAGAVCGMLTVPLDYSKPTGTKIQLALSMVQHSSPTSSYQGAMVVNPGGPGVSGLGLSTLGRRVPNGVGTEYDWVGFDPRGVGSSRPALSCVPQVAKGPRKPYVATTSSLTKAWLATSAAYAAACGKHGGALLNHLTTIDSAMDIDTIRKALRQRQISYYGFSYGTYLGMVYGTLFPTHLHRMVLDSNVDPRQIWYQANLEQDPAFERNMKIWFGWLARHNATYQLGATEAAIERRFYQIQADLQAHPVGPVGGDEWNDIFTAAAYSQSSWNDLATTLTSWVFTGDDVKLEAEYRAADTPGNDNVRAIYLATECTDTAWPRTATKYLNDTRAMYPHARFITWQNLWFNAPCMTWPAPAHHPVAINGSKVPSALLVDETLDAATPYAGSLETRRLFPHSALLAISNGTTHAGSLRGHGCEDGIIATYLSTGHLPARRAGSRADATCAAPAQPGPAG